MNEFELGKILDFSETVEFNLPKNIILIWKDSLKPEVILADRMSDIPHHWLRGNSSLKILGEFESIKAILKSFTLPPGSKVIDIQEGSVINFSLVEKAIRYQGKRLKRVVVVDDSPTIRKLLMKIIEQFSDWKVVAEVENALGIEKAIDEFYPDLITLDLNLGEMNGAKAMKKYIAPHQIPTILITSQNIKDGGLVLEALDAGAIDYIQKPESGKWSDTSEDLKLKMEIALKSKWKKLIINHRPKAPKLNLQYDLNKFIILIGSSTGGTQALQEIFVNLPQNIPPILVTQHIPKGFSKALADRLNSLCPFEIKEAVHGDEIKPNRILIAPGDHHMKLAHNGNQVLIVDEAPINRFRPSVEAMFSSFKNYKKHQIISIMLTGMGKDGSSAMLELRKNGAFNIAQDEQSSVVFGMPKEAIRIGAAQYIKPLQEIADFLPELMSELSKKSKSAS